MRSRTNRIWDETSVTDRRTILPDEFLNARNVLYIVLCHLARRLPPTVDLETLVDRLDLMPLWRFLCVFCTEVSLFERSQCLDPAFGGRLAALALYICDALDFAVVTEGGPNSVAADVAFSVVDSILAEAGYVRRSATDVRTEIRRTFRKQFTRCVDQCCAYSLSLFLAGNYRCSPHVSD